MEEPERRVKAIVCPQCGAKLTMDETEDRTVCEYCDTVYFNADLLGESDFVRTERMRQKTERERLKKEFAIAEKKEEQAEILQFKRGKLSKVVLVFAALAAVGGIVSFSNGSILSGILLILSAAMFLCSWLTGMHVIDLEIKSAHAVCAVAGFGLFILGFIVV